ncbi:MAG: hypothetical protein KDE32_09015 [Novosphingobium sp.]|nr:hypothetical protein [Novosphingobium sp.]
MPLYRSPLGKSASIAILLLATLVQPAIAQNANFQSVTYADLADLADSASVVVHANVRSMARVEDSRAPGLRPGHGRFYMKGKTRALLFGGQAIGDSLAWLVDLPLDSRGKPPALKKRDVIVFARPVSGRPGELQLVGRDSQILYSEAALAQLRPILGEMAAPDAPPPITGVREVIHVPGNLAGAGETQIFLTTADNSAASITVRHQPGTAPQWGVSFSELVAAANNGPQRDTLAWYRLACFLPNTLRPGVNLSTSAMDRQQALADYQMVLGELGTCPRSRR